MSAAMAEAAQTDKASITCSSCKSSAASNNFALVTNVLHSLGISYGHVGLVCVEQLVVFKQSINKYSIRIYLRQSESLLRFSAKPFSSSSCPDLAYSYTLIPTQFKMAQWFLFSFIFVTSPYTSASKNIPPNTSTDEKRGKKGFHTSLKIFSQRSSLMSTVRRTLFLSTFQV